MPELSLPERAVHRALRSAVSALGALPEPLRSRLVGPPVAIDGQTLEPEVALLLRIGRGLGGIAPGSVRRTRLSQNFAAKISGGPTERAGARDVSVPGAHRPLSARFYPSSEPKAPLLVYFHGGGFVFGNLDTHDAPCRILREHGALNVLACTYRLAPEHRFPAAVDDARAAFAWASANAEALGADPARVGVGGDSAGGNLSAVVCQLAAREGGPAPAFQALIYPAMDGRSTWRSSALFSDGFYLTRDAIDWFYEVYAGPDEARSDPRVNPLAAPDLAGLAPALVVTAGFDPLRDEGEAYAERLRAAGVPVAVERFGSLPHGFFCMSGVSPKSRAAAIEIAGLVRTLTRSP